ncbi:MAG: hypothetical protein WBY53_11755 [Acidobacteriaceae bacterium]
MAIYGTTDKVRQRAAIEYIEPARRSGATRVHIHSGNFNKHLVQNRVLPPNRLPLVCNALKSRKFLEDNNLQLEKVDGPPSGVSSTVVYTFSLNPLRGSDKPSNTPQPPDTFLQLRGILKSTYKKLGGGEKFQKSQRETWEE